MLPVMLAAESGPEPTHLPSALSVDAPCCELALPAGTLRISGKLMPELLKILIREMQGGHRKGNLIFLATHSNACIQQGRGKLI